MRRGKLLDPGRPAREKIRKSRKQESESALRHGGAVTPGSGNQWHTKGDVHTKTLHIENKRTDTGRYILKALELRKYRIQAVRSGRRFALQVDLSDDPRDRYVLIPLEDYEKE